MSAFEKAWFILKTQEDWEDWSWDNQCPNCNQGYAEAYKKTDGSYGNPEAEDGEWTYEPCSSCNATGYTQQIPQQYQQFHDAERV